MNKRQIIVKNHITESKALTRFLHDYIDEHNIPHAVFNDFHLASEEIFINIVNYAYPEKSSQNITIELNHSTTDITIIFTDTGYAFNPLTDCTTSIDSNDYGNGGMGIHLIKSLTNQQTYHRIEKHNVFTVTKHYTI